MTPPPVIINCRDRVTPLAEFVAWLEGMGVQEIILLDNDSAYEPLLAYYEQTPHRVIRLDRNYGKYALWHTASLESTRGEYFVYTDPDVLPDAGCPSDVFGRLRDVLDRYRGINKAGLGLLIDDLPVDHPYREQVVAWERGYWQWPLEPGVYFAPIDTTLALYRPGAPPRPTDAARTGRPYVARHLPWYSNPLAPSDEDAFYEARAEERNRMGWAASALSGGLTSSVEARRQSQPSPLTRLRWRFRGRRAVRLGLNLHQQPQA